MRMMIAAAIIALRINSLILSRSWQLLFAVFDRPASLSFLVNLPIYNDAPRLGRFLPLLLLLLLPHLGRLARLSLAHPTNTHT